jgi:hypothetical protein
MAALRAYPTPPPPGTPALPAARPGAFFFGNGMNARCGPDHGRWRDNAQPSAVPGGDKDLACANAGIAKAADKLSRVFSREETAERLDAVLRLIVSEHQLQANCMIRGSRPSNHPNVADVCWGCPVSDSECCMPRRETQCVCFQRKDLESAVSKD